MLATADADLVRRDPAIVGLATLLDPDRLLAALRRALPDADLQRVTSSYVRYKPGTSCLVGIRLEAACTVVDSYAIAYRAGARDKLSKARNAAITRGPLAAGRLVLDDGAIVVSIFPNDRQLKALAHLQNPESRGELLRKLLPERSDLWEGTLRGLRYKPDRRYVAQLLTADGAQAVLKFYSAKEYADANVGAEAFASRKWLRVARQLGRCDTQRLVAWEWLHGRSLDEALLSSTDNPQAGEIVGAALAELHSQNPAGLARLRRAAEISTLEEVARGLGFLAPRLSKLAHGLSRQLAIRLIEQPALSVPIHNDFYAAQVLWDGETVGILDLDQCARGDPARDLGNFVAHLECDVSRGALAPERTQAWHEALLEGYEQVSQRPARARTQFYAAAGLLQLAPHLFRDRIADWPQRTETLLERVQEMLGGLPAAITQARIARDPPRARPKRACRVKVSDPFGVAGDPRMIFLGQAIDALAVKRQFEKALPQWFGGRQRSPLRTIHVTRYKPGRRCLIEYAFQWDSSGSPPETETFVGKARAKGLDDKSFDLLHALWRAGFDDECEDRISVAEPVGCIPGFEMFLQRKVPGADSTGLLEGPSGVTLAGRAAEAIYKLHQSNVVPRRRHGMGDELQYLQSRLSHVAQSHPQWARRLSRIGTACERLAASIPQVTPRPIHRDFYSDHVIVDGPSVYLVDLDLCSIGDPALDVGNFLGHITEQSLRTFGRADALADREHALEQRYLELSDQPNPAALRAYATLTLVRHIYISTQISSRRPHTEALLDLCEQRCGAAHGQSAKRRPSAVSWGESWR